MNTGISFLRGVMALLVGAMATVAMAAPPVKVAFLATLTGAEADQGKAVLMAMKLEEARINKDLKRLGLRPIQLVVKDTQTNPQSAVLAAQAAVAAGSVLSVGPFLSSETLATFTNLYNAGTRMVMISPIATSPKVTHVKDDDFLYRTVPADTKQGPALATMALAQKFKTVAIIYANDSYGEGLAGTFKKAFMAGGGVVQTSVPYEDKKATYKSDLRAATKGHPDVCFLPAMPSDGIIIAREGASEGYCPHILLSDSMATMDVARALVSVAKGRVFGVTPRPPLVVPAALKGNNLTKAQKAKKRLIQEMAKATRAFDMRHKAKYGVLPQNSYARGAVTAFQVGVLAAEGALKAGFTPEKDIKAFRVAVRDQLRKITSNPSKAGLVKPGDFMGALKRVNKNRPVTYQGMDTPAPLFDKNGDLDVKVRDAYSAWYIVRTASGKADIIYKPLP